VFRIRIGSGFNQVSAKVMDVFLLRAEGFSCSLDVLYGGLGLSELRCIFNFLNFFVIKSQNPGSGLDPDQDRYLAQNAVSGYGLNESGSETLLVIICLFFSGCDHAGLPSPQHCGDVRQLLSRGRTVGGHGVPGGGRPY
jgi:hypothetical protein